MNLRPIKDRVLIRPEIPATETPSGLVLAEQRKPEQTGTVIAVGERSQTIDIERALDALKDSELGIVFSDGCVDCQWADIESTLRALAPPPLLVAVGDYVVFSWTAGQEIWVEDGDERYLLMRESDILCVVEGLAV